jgi:hypothetical protein
VPPLFVGLFLFSATGALSLAVHVYLVSRSPVLLLLMNGQWPLRPVVLKPTLLHDLAAVH